MTLDQARIRQLVPHAGAMCLLASVDSWSDTEIRCTSPQPRHDHPLARAGVLPAIAAAEYAAQATAVHGALLDGHDGPRGGMLASLIDVELKFAAFPAAAGELSVMAQLLSRSQAGCLYSFEVSHAQQGIASGRLMVAFAKDAA